MPTGVIVGADGVATIVMFTPLSVPITPGLLLTTLILYIVPPVVVQGIVQEIVPELRVLDKLPMFTGEPKPPVESES